MQFNFSINLINKYHDLLLEIHKIFFSEIFITEYSHNNFRKNTIQESSASKRNIFMALSIKDNAISELLPRPGVFKD